MLAERGEGLYPIASCREGTPPFTRGWKVGRDALVWLSVLGYVLLVKATSKSYAVQHALSCLPSMSARRS